MNLFLHGIGPDDGKTQAADQDRRCPAERARRARGRGADQPALRQEVVDHRRQRRGRDRPGVDHLQPAGLLDDDVEQAAQLRPAREVDAQDPRPRRRRRARQRALRGRRGREGPPQAAAGVRGPHAAAPADRHLLRPGREGERALLRPQARREGAVDEEGLDLRPAHQQGLHAEDAAHGPRRPRRVRRSATTRRTATSARRRGTRRRTPKAGGGCSPTTRSSRATSAASTSSG